MPDAEPLDYAIESHGLESFQRRLRRIVAIVAIAFGGGHLLGDVVSQLQYLDVLRGVPGFTFDVDKLTDWIETVPMWMCNIGLIVAGVMLLANARHAVLMLRIGASFGILFHVAVFIMRITGVLWVGTIYPTYYVTFPLWAWEQSAFVVLLAALPLTCRAR